MTDSETLAEILKSLKVIEEAAQEYLNRLPAIVTHHSDGRVTTTCRIRSFASFGGTSDDPGDQAP